MAESFESLPPRSLWSRPSVSRRSFMKWGAVAGLGAVSLESILAACAPSSNSPTGTIIKPGGKLRAAIAGQPDSLDPQTSKLYASAQVYDNLFSKLIDIDADGSIVGMLATKWTQRDDRTWVFDLREGVHFHNGDKFTANDVKYTFERMLDPKTASTYATFFTPLSGVEVASPTQVIFHLSTPYGPFLTNLAADGQIMNQRAVESSNSAQNPVGTGPFQFVDWVQGDHITLKKFGQYFQPGRPFLDQVTIYTGRAVDEARVAALRAGELDWLDGVPDQDFTALQADSSLRSVVSTTAGYPEFFLFNTAKPPMNNKLLREAVAWAIDRKQIRDIVYFKAGEVGSEEVPTGSTWYSHNDPFTAGPNLDLARQKFQQSGASQGLTLRFLAYTQSPQPAKVGQVLAQQLKPLGINVEVDAFDTAVWFSKLIHNDYEISILFNERTIDPDGFYSLFWVKNGGDNSTGYYNPTLEPLIQGAAAETDPGKRRSLYTQVRQVVFDDLPGMFIHYRVFSYFMRGNVAGSTSNPTLELRFDRVGFTS